MRHGLRVTLVRVKTCWFFSGDILKTVKTSGEIMSTDYVTAAHNILIYDDLVHALRALSNAGVPVIVLKGAALAATIYPSLAHRPMGDADLLVRPGDRDWARAVLEAIGYRFLPEPRQRFSPFGTEFTGEMSFRRNERTLVELHWELTPGE